MRSNGCVERVQRRVLTPRTPHHQGVPLGVGGPGVVDHIHCLLRSQDAGDPSGRGAGGGALHAVKIQGKSIKRKNAPHEKNRKLTYFARNGPKEAFPLAPARSAEAATGVHFCLFLEGSDLPGAAQLQIFQENALTFE